MYTDMYLQNAEAAPSLSVVEPDAGMKIVEMNLANAVLAIDIVPSTAKPSIRDIYVALRNQFGFQTSPIHVANFHTDFVIQFATPEERDRVLLHEFLHGRNFNMILIPWSRSYRSKIISWQTLVAIDVTNLPPHTCYPHCLQPLLSPHCKVLNYKFNKRVGACRAIAFALSASSIPSHGHVAVQYTHQDGVYNHAFPVAMQAYLHHQVPKFASDSSPCDSPVSPSSLDTGGFYILRAIHSSLMHNLLCSPLIADLAVFLVISYQRRS
jgi:hypothetical protein